MMPASDIECAILEPPISELKHRPSTNSIPETIIPTNIDIHAENERLKAENHQLQVENGILKNENQKIRQDLMTLRRLYESTDQNCAENLKVKILEQKCHPDNGLFNRYEKVFGVETIERLKKFDSSRKRDSSFILECMRKICGNDEQLKHVTACGRKKAAQKSNFPPEKRQLLEDIFIERLTMKQIDYMEIYERLFRLNELINNGINNIVRARNGKKTSNERREDSDSKNMPNFGDAIDVSQKVINLQNYSMECIENDLGDAVSNVIVEIDTSHIGPQSENTSYSVTSNVDEAIAAAETAHISSIDSSTDDRSANDEPSNQNKRAKKLRTNWLITKVATKMTNTGDSQID